MRYSEIWTLLISTLMTCLFIPKTPSSTYSICDTFLTGFKSSMLVNVSNCWFGQKKSHFLDSLSLKKEQVPSMTRWKHYRSLPLRRRLMVYTGFSACWIFIEDLFLTLPIIKVLFTTCCQEPKITSSTPLTWTKQQLEAF